MIFKITIKTLILTYCIDVIFEKFYRIFQTLDIGSVNIQNFIFIHYTRYLDFIFQNGLDFAFHTFMKYLDENNIKLGSFDCHDIYIGFWNKKEDELIDNEINYGHGGFNFWRSSEDDKL